LIKTNRNHIKKTIQSRNIKPKLVGFLANDDPAAVKYAEWTAKSCKQTGVVFDLMKIDKLALEDNILKANADKTVNGIMIYYPVFGDHFDLYLQNRVSYLKDVEGLSQVAVQNVYRNKRFVDKDSMMKTIIPCTPLAVIKVRIFDSILLPRLFNLILSDLGVYWRIQSYTSLWFSVKRSQYYHY
jgi:methylenetetrahydrofolate dehydrogenase (NAD+)